MTSWTLEKSEHEEDADLPWTVHSPDGWFTDFEDWEEALDFMRERLRMQEND